MKVLIWYRCRFCLLLLHPSRADESTFEKVCSLFSFLFSWGSSEEKPRISLEPLLPGRLHLKPGFGPRGRGAWIHHCGGLIKRLGQCEKRRDSISPHLRFGAERAIVELPHILPSRVLDNQNSGQQNSCVKQNVSCLPQRFICFIYKCLPLWPSPFPLAATRSRTKQIIHPFPTSFFWWFSEPGNKKDAENAWNPWKR